MARPFASLLLRSTLLPARAPSRLRASANRRYLGEASGRPFLYPGDTASQLVPRLNRGAAALCLRRRAARGFTMVQAVLRAGHGGLDEPNADGEPAPVGREPDRPKEAYFRHADWIIPRASELGLLMGVLSNRGACWKTGPARIFDPANSCRYGLLPGRRCRDASLIRILGGGGNVETPHERAIIDAMARGRRAGDGGAHRMTFHPQGPGQSAQGLQDAEWLDFHGNQASHGARGGGTGRFIGHDLQLQPLRPALDGEPRSETIPAGFCWTNLSRLDRLDDFDLRQAARRAVLAGACGHSWGHDSVWQRGQPGRRPALWASIR